MSADCWNSFPPALLKNAICELTTWTRWFWPTATSGSPGSIEVQPTPGNFGSALGPGRVVFAAVAASVEEPGGILRTRDGFSAAIGLCWIGRETCGNSRRVSIGLDLNLFCPGANCKALCASLSAGP